MGLFPKPGGLNTGREDSLTNSVLEVMDKKRSGTQERLMVDEDRKRKINTHVDQVPGRLRHEVSRLIECITRPCCSTVEQVYAIYRWVTRNIVYDVQRYHRTLRLHDNPIYNPLAGGHTDTSDTDEEKAAAALLTGKAICTGYTALIRLFCRFIGIPCVKIAGWAKGSDYLPGRQYKVEEPNHEWNAAYVLGEWCLIDSCWGAGYLSLANHNFVPKTTEHYFLTPPQDFVRDHFPVDYQWQLMKEPITSDEFLEDLLVKPAFFEFALKNCTISRCVVDCDSIFQFSFELTHQTHIMFELRDVAPGDPKQIWNSFVQLKVTAKRANFRVLPPKPGEFHLSVFGCLVSRTIAPRLLMVVCIKSKSFYTGDFCESLRHFRYVSLGPNILFHQLKLDFIGTYRSLVVTSNGKCTMRLRTGKNAKFHAEVQNIYEVWSSPVRWNRQEKTLVLNVTVSNPGCYRLVLFASSKLTDDLYRCVCSFLVINRRK